MSNLQSALQSAGSEEVAERSCSLHAFSARDICRLVDAAARCSTRHRQACCRHCAHRPCSTTALLSLSWWAVIRTLFMMAISVPVATALVRLMMFVPFVPAFTPPPVPFAPAPASPILDPATRCVVVTCAGLHPPTWAPGIVLTVPCPPSRYPDKAASRRWRRFIARRRRRHDD